MRYTAAAMAVAAVIIVSSTIYLGAGAGEYGLQSGSSAELIIQLTDPPVVPKGTSSVNLTYTSIGLLVGVPVGGGQQTTNAVSVSPPGGSATLDLLKLQNVLQTIASTSLPNGSRVYSFTFAIGTISIDVNGTKAPVALATGGNALVVTLARPSALMGADVALLQLNPVIVDTPTGYQMIPSAVGIIRAEQTGNQDDRQVGYQQRLSSDDANQLENARGYLTATLSTLSVSGNATTITVEVRNMGNTSVALDAIGIHGNFSAGGGACAALSNATEGGYTTTSTTIKPASTATTESDCESGYPDLLIFVPSNSTVTGTACVTQTMRLATGDVQQEIGGLALTRGQCVDLTFSGEIYYSATGVLLVPSIASGQVYWVSIIASNGADLNLSCSLPLSPTSCSAVYQGRE
jgi:hypothetical protein